MLLFFKASANTVAFSAYASNTANYNTGNTVQFDQELLDTGNHYDNTQGKFTCPANGLYLFTASFEANDDNSMVGEIVVDDVHSLRVYVEYSTHDQNSNTVLIECLESQQVWVECTADGRQMSGGRSSSFSGVLISMYP